MRKIREILRLNTAGLSARQIAGSVGVARSTVADCLRRAGQAGLGWPLPLGLDDADLEHRLYPPAPVSDNAVPVPDWTQLHAELQRKGMTLLLLWQEYMAAVPTGYQYSRFCDLYRAWSQTQDLVLRPTSTASAQFVWRGYMRSGSENFVGRHFWARGYFVSTAGRDEAVIRAYVRNQEQEDQRIDHLSLLR